MTELAASGGDPPPQPLAAQLSFDHLPPDRFEDLCRDLLERKYAGEFEDVQRYGVSGEAQDGIDIYGVHGDRYLTAQCRRLEAVQPAEIAAAVSGFLAGKWAADAEIFIYCTSAPTRRRSVQDRVEILRRALRERPKGAIEFEVWGRDRLSQMLRQEPDLVEQYWSAETALAYCPGQRPLFGALVEFEARFALQPAGDAPVVLDISDRSRGVRVAVEKLRAEHPQELALVQPYLGEGAPLSVAEQIRAPHPGVRGASPELWAVLARLAESAGSWSDAATAWEHLADHAGDPVQALMNAAVAAAVAGERDRHGRLFEQATGRNDRHPRVLFERANAIDSPTERLQLLEGVESDDPQEQALLGCQRAIAHIQLEDLAAADSDLAFARESDSELLQVELVEINLAVQRARIAERDGTLLDTADLVRAERTALKLRDDKLLPQKRVEESCRLLMFAADAAALRRDAARAGEILRSAHEGELAWPANREVLGYAAVRAGQWEVARSAIEGSEPTNSIRIVRAIVELELGGDGEQARIVLTHLLEAEEPADRWDAALTLLMDALRRRTDWSDQAEEVLLDQRPTSVLTLKAAYLARTGRYEGAKRLLAPYAAEPWAKELALRLAWEASDQAMVPLALDVLGMNPSPWVRLLCANALLDGGEPPGTARTAAAPVKDDQNLTAAVRADACEILLRALEQLDRWEDARRLVDEWVAIDASDPRVGPWQARIGNRLRGG